MKLKIEIKKTGFVRKRWKWKAVAGNGRIIASGRGFNTFSNAKESVETLINYIKNDNYILIHD